MTTTASDQTAAGTARGLLADSVRGRRPAVARLAGWSVVEALPTFLSGLLVAAALDAFVAGDERSGFGWLAVYAVSVVIGSVGARRALDALASLVEPFRDHLVAGAVRGALRRTSRTSAQKASGSVAVLTEQVEIAREAFAAGLMVTQEFVVAVGAAVVGLLVLAPLTALFVGPPLLLALVVFSLAVRRMAHEQARSITADETFAADMTELAIGLRDVAASGAREAVGRRLDESITSHAVATTRIGRLSAVGVLAVAVGSWLPLLLIVGFGPYLIGHGASVGVVVGAATYVLLGLQPALQALVHGVSGAGLWLLVTLRRLSQVVDCRNVESGNDGASPMRSAVPAADAEAVDASLADVTFAYSPWSEPILRNVDLQIPDDDHVAVVGPSGVGKSTLAALLAGTLLPRSGMVRLGGAPTEDLSVERLSALRVLVPQEAYVVADTVRANLEYLGVGARYADVTEAVDRLGARELIERLGGYEAVVEPALLSAADAQLLTLVRAYRAPARLVILDEATCHLDPATEELVERSFADREGTLVVIAHRMSSALRARRIVVLDGSSLQVGTHEELLCRSSQYSDLLGYWTSVT